MSGKVSLVLLLLLVLAGGGAAVVGASLVDDVPPPLPTDTVQRPVELLYARPYVLQEAEEHMWRSERPLHTSGVAVVLGVDDVELLYPRQSAQPVLQVGAQTAERFNHGHGSGHVVAFIPAPVGADGLVDLDLATTPIFFGDAELPERLGEAELQARLGEARSVGIAPPTAETVAEVSESQVSFRDGWELRVWATDLVEAYAPDEADLISGWRVPRLPR